MEMGPEQRSIEILHLPGHVPYSQALEAQIQRRNEVEQGKAPNALFTLEHAPVITCGRNTKQEHILFPNTTYREAGIEVIQVDRGGDVTYHGPGQLTAYPILNLTYWTPSVNWYLRQLEIIIIATLADLGIDAGPLGGYTGVWTGKGKVAQVGIGIHRWTSYHGIAINVDPDMSHFAMIVPCGIADKPVTTLRELKGEEIAIDEVRRTFEEHFIRHFQQKLL